MTANNGTQRQRETVGQWVRRNREALGLSQDRLGTALGLSGGSPIAKWETSRSRPHDANLAALERFFGAPYDPWGRQPPRANGRPQETAHNPAPPLIPDFVPLRPKRWIVAWGVAVEAGGANEAHALAKEATAANVLIIVPYDEIPARNIEAI